MNVELIKRAVNEECTEFVQRVSDPNYQVTIDDVNAGLFWFRGITGRDALLELLLAWTPVDSFDAVEIAIHIVIRYGRHVSGLPILSAIIEGTSDPGARQVHVLFREAVKKELKDPKTSDWSYETLNKTSNGDRKAVGAMQKFLAKHAAAPYDAHRVHKV